MATTVEQITAAYDNILVPMLGPGQDRCTVCKSVVQPGWTCCYQCNRQRSLLPQRATVVAPIALSFKGGQWAYELSAYKNSPNADARQTMTVKLGAVLWRWLELHEPHVADTAGVTAPFPIVTSVPSTSGRSDHPLPMMLRTIVGPTCARYCDLLSANPLYPDGSREPRLDRFVAQRLQGQPVLLIDDQWTSGARAQSAACALRLAGSGPVGVVPLGRHFDPSPGEPYREAAQRYIRAAVRQGWDWNDCCLVDRPVSRQLTSDVQGVMSW
jgi:hypothetical protein